MVLVQSSIATQELDCYGIFTNYLKFEKKMLKFILSTEILNLEFSIALALLLLLASETERNNSGVWLVQEFKVASFSMSSL